MKPNELDKAGISKETTARLLDVLVSEFKNKLVVLKEQERKLEEKIKHLEEATLEIKIKYDIDDE